MSLRPLHIGFVPLSDAAVLVAAQEIGFAAEQGLDLHLAREASWSNIRDKLAMGLYPLAHMPAPLALATGLGLGPVPVELLVPFVLARNGSLIATTPALAAALPSGGLNNAAAIGAALRRHFSGRRLRVGVPYPQSMQRELLCYWLQRAGGGTDCEDCEVVFSVAPPAMLGEVLAAGEIDLFAVGEPWASLAVEKGQAEVLLCGASIWSAAPEKVLGVRAGWAAENAGTLDRLLRALHRAGEWCGQRENHTSLSEILSLPRYLDAPAEVIERGLTGEIVVNGRGQIRRNRMLLGLSGTDTGFPWESGAGWIAQRAARGWGVSRRAAREQVRAIWRPDLYRRALAETGVNLPGANRRLEGANIEPLEVQGSHGPLILGVNRFFDGAMFDPDA